MSCSKVAILAIFRFAGLALIVFLSVPIDPADSGNDSSGGNLLFAVEAVPGQLRELQEGGSRVEESVDTLPRHQFSPGRVPGNGLLSAAFGDLPNPALELIYQGAHATRIVLETEENS